MRIEICDDEPIIAQALAEMVTMCLESMQMEAEIMLFLTGDSLLREAAGLDLIFLDIEMPRMDGIETGGLIRKTNMNCKIIMATSRVERFKEAFQINAFRFITKPFEIDEIQDALAAYQRTRIGEEPISLFLKRQIHMVQQRDIKYIKTYNGYIEAKVGGVYLRKDISLLELEQILEKRLFVRVHKQYIVNMRFIQMSKKGILIDDIVIPISRRKKREFEEAYMEFDMNYRG